MPQSFVLEGLIADSEKVVLNAHVATKAESAYVVDKLKEFPMIASVETTAVNRTLTLGGDYCYAFEVSCYYLPYGEEPVAEGEGE
jgi:hypothetical protein